MPNTLSLLVSLAMIAVAVALFVGVKKKMGPV